MKISPGKMLKLESSNSILTHENRIDLVLVSIHIHTLMMHRVYQVSKYSKLLVKCDDNQQHNKRIYLHIHER